MKAPKSIFTSVSLSALIAVVGSLSSANSALAQAKGGELLAKVQRSNAASIIQKSKTGPAAMTSCPKCKDEWVAVAQPPGKGGRAETALVARHQCPTCSTQFEKAGVGKQAITSVKHVCHEGGNGANACSPSKVGVE